VTSYPQAESGRRVGLTDPHVWVSQTHRTRPTRTRPDAPAKRCAFLGLSAGKILCTSRALVRALRRKNRGTVGRCTQMRAANSVTALCQTGQVTGFKALRGFDGRRLRPALRSAALPAPAVKKKPKRTRRKTTETATP